MNSTGVYMQIVGSKYYFRRPELMKLDGNSNTETCKPYDLVRSNEQMIAFERVVAEPDI